LSKSNTPPTCFGLILAIIKEVKKKGNLGYRLLGDDHVMVVKCRRQMVKCFLFIVKLLD